MAAQFRQEGRGRDRRQNSSSRGQAIARLTAKPVVLRASEGWGLVGSHALDGEARRAASECELVMDWVWEAITFINQLCQP